MRSSLVAVLLVCFSVTMHAQLLPSTDSVFFTNVKVGFSRNAILSVEAQSDLTVTDIRIFPQAAVTGEFQIITPTQLNFSMLKGERLNFILRCRPQLGGKRTAFMTIYTDAGDTTVQLIGDVTTTQPDVVTEPDTIDFGVIAPNEIREIPYVVYGAGIDSVEVVDLFVTNDNGPSVYFEIYPTNAAVTLPHRMGPTDTLHMMARFTGYDPVGTKTGRSIVTGEVSGGIHCEFRGVVGKPEMQFSPQLLDLGIVPLGVTIDTFIYLHSIGEGAVTVESITPPPSYTISNIPPLPHDINQGDSLKLDVSFTAVAPDIYEEPLEAMAKATATGGRFRSALLKAIVLPNQLLVRPPDVLEVPCAVEATYQFTPLQLTDTANSPITISRITSDNSNVVIVDSASLPITLGPGETILIDIDHTHRVGDKSDSAIIEIYSGNYVILRDTIRIQTIEQFVELDAVVTNNQIRISTKNDIAAFNINALAIDIAVDRSDVVALLLDALVAHPTLTGATIAPSFDTINSIYHIVVTSTVPISLITGDIIASIPLQHFYSRDSVASITASCTVPELSAGCLTFSAATTSVMTPDDCNDDILRRHLRGERLIGNVSISENPITRGAAQVQFDLVMPSELHLAVYDGLGNIVLEDYQTGLAAGRNHIALPVHPYSSGSYTALLTARNQGRTESVSIPFLIAR